MNCVRLTREQELEAFSTGNFDLLILSVIPLATKVGRSIARQLAYDMDDAKSLATLAVVRSIKKFDPSRGYRLSTFIWRCVSSYVRYEITREQTKHVSGMQLENEHTVPDRDAASDLRDEKKLYWQAIKELPERERSILERRRAGQTFRKISADTGIGRSRVGQIYKATINDLRTKFEPVM